MNVLLIGSGGREHAIAWKVSQSPLLNKLYIAPGNAGTEQHGENVALNASDHEAIKSFILEHNIDMLIIGPEAPLVEGMHDYVLSQEEIRNVKVIGPVKQAAMLEGSKQFAKDFMQKYNIPTAAYKTFGEEDLQEALDYLTTIKPPYVLKADGLAAGKGVLIIDSLEEAQQEMTEMLQNKKFGDASSKVVIEEFLSGIELSVFVLTDGKNYILLPEAKDYKRIGEGDTGLNTGGMGSISPVPFADKELMDKIITRVIDPTIAGLQKEEIVYQGFIFFGLINVGGDPYVIEYNARMGDPEAESVIPRIKSDLLEKFKNLAEGNINKSEIEIDDRFATSVFLVSGGYPESYENGKVINGLDATEDVICFHAGTKKSNDQIVTSGGRVIAITSFGDTMEEALNGSYRNIGKISFEKMYFRKDLGFDL